MRGRGLGIREMEDGEEEKMGSRGIEQKRRRV